MYSSPVEIHPGGVSDKYLIDLMCALQRSMYGLCLKLDNDGGVPLTTYVANCYSAIFHHVITDYAGNRTTDPTTVDYIISPVSGLPAAALNQWLFDFANGFETLTEQLDTDVLTDSTYEALCYHALVYPYMFESRTGTIIGNDNSSGGFTSTPAAGSWEDAKSPYILVKIGPTGKPSDRVLCELCYDFINAWETMCEQLDADGTVTDVNYEALWYTATVLIRVANAEGNVLGNAQTRLG